MELTVNGIQVSVSDVALAELLRQRLMGQDQVSAVDVRDIPCIGAEWPRQGGIYAGMARGRDGQSDYHLIAGPEFDGTQDWNESVKWSQGISVDGLNDFTLPFRKEQALLFANVPELFKPEWYWSCEQRASSSNGAWLQDFNNGNRH